MTATGAAGALSGSQGASFLHIAWGVHIFRSDDIGKVTSLTAQPATLTPVF